MITIVLIGITVLLSYRAFSNRILLSKFIFNPYRVSNNSEYYRFLSSGFVHADWGHLLFNMFTFFFFGRNVEFIYTSIFGLVEGSIIFVLIYFLGIIISEIPTYLKYRSFAGYNSLGASGGVSTILFISILYFPLEDICLYGLLCLPGFILGLLYLIYSYYADKNQRDNVNHSAHFVGAAFGIIIAAIIQPDILLSFIDQISQYSPF